MSHDYPNLLTDALRARQVLAAWYIRHCRHIIEVGGWRNPISEYSVGAHETITVIDPLIDDLASSDGRAIVRHIRGKIEDYQPSGDEDALVMLGFEGWGHLDRECILRLLRRVRVTVLEASTSHPPAQASIREIIERDDLCVRVQLFMTAGGAGVDPAWRFKARSFYVLDRKE